MVIVNPVFVNPAKEWLIVAKGGHLLGTNNFTKLP